MLRRLARLRQSPVSSHVSEIHAPRKTFVGRSIVTNKCNTAGPQETAEDRDSAPRHQGRGAPSRSGPDLANTAIRGLSAGWPGGPVPTSEAAYCDLLQTTLVHIVLPNAPSCRLLPLKILHRSCSPPVCEVARREGATQLILQQLSQPPSLR